ncbi:DUF1507 family protein [Paenibacillus thermoaerophilus]|uniref:UPF0358 protein ACFQWB_02015 n=1 Tax=Paenibacillus thermoaerophilus TaxID=1215385 RepID=A0ABW2UXV7_9BACL|nr:YlaN family protein [Paenibacillus thermoaerophilus]TMV19123.1 DUF1507 family protein [Paenibacillus thermoaerophilus]
MTSSEQVWTLNEKALRLLEEDADKIAKLIAVQMDTLMNRRCPLYEEVLDTQMYGLSREIDFAIRAGLVDAADGKALLTRLERKLAELYDALNKS